MPDTNRIPDLLLEQYLLGELPKDAQTRIEEELSRNKALQARLHALQESNLEILDLYPAEEEAGTIERKARVQAVKETLGREHRTASVFTKHPLLIPATVLAAVLLFTLIPYMSHTPLPEQQALETTRLKGLQPRLQIFRKQEKSTVQLQDGDKVQQGDVLQLRYISGTARHGMIFSLDGRGSFTLHYPEQPGMPTELIQEGKVPLEYSYELDDAPKFERFYFVTASKPFDTKQVVAAVEKAIKEVQGLDTMMLALPGELGQTVLTLKKDQP